MKKVYINGYFTKEYISGIPRYAFEIVKRLDNYFEPEEAELVIPSDATNIPDLKNIKICRWEDRGKKREVKGVLWGDLSYGPYVRRHGGVNVNLSNRPEWVRDSLTTMHDIISLENRKYDFLNNSLKVKIIGIINYMWFRYKIFIKKNSAKVIVTVSKFSETELCSKAGFPKEMIRIIGNGWEHIKDIIEIDEHLDDRIIKNQFYFFIGSIKPHKNIKWIIEEAKTMPNEIFVVAGRIPDEIVSEVKGFRDNIIFLGHISDGYVKYLMMNCKALLFPSYVEGFGIPPLEMLALGGKAIVSDIPVMHELYGNSVFYINPYDSNVDLNLLISNPVENAEKVLNEHNWDQSAKEWFLLIDKVRREL